MRPNNRGYGGNQMGGNRPMHGQMQNGQAPMGGNMAMNPQMMQ
jgi:hypothetical protein